MLFGAVSAPAQHTLAAKFDLDQAADVDGHGDPDRLGQPLRPRADEGGRASRCRRLWAVEVDGPIILANNGWSETSLAAGEVIRVEGFAARNGSKQISGQVRGR